MKCLPLSVGANSPCKHYFHHSFDWPPNTEALLSRAASRSSGLRLAQSARTLSFPATQWSLMRPPYSSMSRAQRRIFLLIRLLPFLAAGKEIVAVIRETIHGEAFHKMIGRRQALPVGVQLPLPSRPIGLGCIEAPTIHRQRTGATSWYFPLGENASPSVLVCLACVSGSRE